MLPRYGSCSSGLGRSIPRLFRSCPFDGQASPDNAERQGGKDPPEESVGIELPPRPNGRIDAGKGPFAAYFAEKKHRPNLEPVAAFDDPGGVWLILLFAFYFLLFSKLPFER